MGGVLDRIVKRPELVWEFGRQEGRQERMAAFAQLVFVAGPILSAFAELRGQLEEARELNQLELVDRLEDEIETLGRELSRALGLGGRDRRAASASERARINVTRAIKIALERIAEHNPALAALLTSSIRTGTFCSYTPDSRLPASWQL